MAITKQALIAAIAKLRADTATAVNPGDSDAGELGDALVPDAELAEREDLLPNWVGVDEARVEPAVSLLLLPVPLAAWISGRVVSRPGHPGLAAPRWGRGSRRRCRQSARR